MSGCIKFDGASNALNSDWAYMFDASSVACVEYLNASKGCFSKETD